MLSEISSINMTKSIKNSKAVKLVRTLLLKYRIEMMLEIYTLHMDRGKKLKNSGMMP